MENPILYKDLFDGADITRGIDGLIQQINAVRQEMVDMLNDVKTQAKEASNSLKGASSGNSQGQSAIRQQSAEVQALVKQYKDLTDTIKLLDKHIVNLGKHSQGGGGGCGGRTPAGDTKELMSLGKAYQSLSSILSDTNINLNSLLQTEKQKQQADKYGRAVAESQVGSYNQLYAEYNLLKLVINELSEAELNNAEIGGVLLEQADQRMEKMKAIQEAAGKHTLSVGDYGKAINGLNIATKQVLRELPSMANGINTFFIAISNNIPIFIDNLKKAKEEAGSFKKALTALITGQFLLEGVLLVSLTLLSKYGKDLLSLVKIFRNHNEVLKKTLELHSQLFDSYNSIAKVIKDSNKIQEDALNRELEMLRARNASLGEIQAKERELVALRTANNEQLKAEYKNNLLGEDVIKDYTNNQKMLLAETRKLRAMEEKGLLNAKKSGEMHKKDKEAIDVQKEVVKWYQMRVDAAEDILESEKNLTKEMGVLLQEQYRERYELYQKELALYRENEDIRLSLLHDRFKQQREIAKTETKRMIQDIDDILNKAPEWLSPEQRKAYTEQLELLRDALVKKVRDITIEQYEAEQKAISDNEKIRLGLLDEGQEKELAILKQGYDEKKKALAEEILYNDELTDKEREQYEKRVKLYDKEYRQKQNAILKKYAEKDLKRALDLELAQYARQHESEYLIQEDALKKQIKYWEDSIAITALYGGLSEEELDKYITEVESTIADLEKQLKKHKPQDLWDLLRIDISAEGKSAIKEGFSATMDWMNNLIDKRLELAQVAVEAAERERESAKDLLDYEMEARANGYTYNIEYARKEYEERLALERKALQEKAKIEKAQEALNSAEQASSLITATANIIKAYSSMPVVGQIASIAAIATMWGTFTSAKLQASKVTKYGEGMSEYLDYGGSHASGNDIDFGVSKDGTRRRVERGEMIGVINKRNVNKYGVGEIASIIDSLNHGTFEEKYGLAFAGLALGNANSVTDLSNVESGINTLVKQGETRVVQTSFGRIEYRGNNKRIIRN